MTIVILTEIILSKDKTGLWLWIVKLSTYSILVWTFSSNRGQFHWQYVIMIVISCIALFISRTLIKKRSITMIGTILAYTIGGILYIIAIVHNPKDYGYHHIVFMLINAISYILLTIEIIQQEKERVNLIIPIFAFITCLIYVLVICFA